MVKLPDPTHDLDPEGQAIFDKLAGDRGGLSGMYLTMMNHPRLTEKVGVLGSFLRFEGVLPGDVRETAILLSARAMNAPYEWEKHVGPALKEGVKPEEIEAIRTGDAAPGALSDRDLFLQEFVAIVLSESVLPEDIQIRAEQTYGTEGLVELVVLVSFYRMINSVIVSFDVDPPDAGPLPF